MNDTHKAVAKAKSGKDGASSGRSIRTTADAIAKQVNKSLTVKQ